MQLCPECQTPVPEHPDTCPTCGHIFDDLPRYPQEPPLEPELLIIEPAPDVYPAPAYGLAPYDTNGPIGRILVFVLLNIVLGIALIWWLF